LFIKSESPILRNTIHQKPLLKAAKGKKNNVFALFLDYA
jgi:hypothetical protein